MRFVGRFTSTTLLPPAAAESPSIYMPPPVAVVSLFTAKKSEEVWNLDGYVNSEAFLKRQDDLRRSLMQENFDVLSIRERELYLMLAGDGETVFIFLVLLPYMDVFELPKAYIWKLRRLATRFRARPFVTTMIPEVRNWFFVPLTALRDDGSCFVLEMESCRHKGFYLHRLISEELQQRLV